MGKIQPFLPRIDANTGGENHDAKIAFETFVVASYTGKAVNDFSLEVIYQARILVVSRGRERMCNLH